MLQDLNMFSLSDLTWDVSFPKNSLKLIKKGFKWPGRVPEKLIFMRACHVQTEQQYASKIMQYHESHFERLLA